jgi:hypothetical protein
MAELQTIQNRGQALFERLLEAESRGNQVLNAVTQRMFSWL